MLVTLYNILIFVKLLNNLSEKNEPKVSLTHSKGAMNSIVIIPNFEIWMS